MELSLYSFRVFLEVADRQSFSRAAEALYITQPAVSLQIKSLEDHFRSPLFVRSHTEKLRLTRTGRTLTGYAQQFLKLQLRIRKQ